VAWLSWKNRCGKVVDTIAMELSGRAIFKDPNKITTFLG